MTVGKNTPSAMVAIFEVSPIPSQRMSSGRSAIFGIGNRADTIGKPAARASENSPTASPTEMPTAVPMIQPAPIRTSDIETWAHNSPDVASRHSARTIADGLGRNRALTRPNDPAACQAASTIANTSHEVAPRGAGANPVARNRTACRAAGLCASASRVSIETGSRIHDFPFGRERAFAYQRPQPGMDRAELRLEAGLVARTRSEEHTSELQSRLHLVCSLLLEKKKIKILYAFTALDTKINK